MGYRAIAFDMDGTLLTPDKKISPECMAAIGEAKAAGKMVLLCSGRSPSELREYLEILPEVRWLCTTAGALLYDAREKKILEMHPFDQQTAEELVDMNPQQGVESSEPAPAYQGPSVISYELEGRKALSLPVPAYKGYGAGDVLVDIEVNPAGRVTAAKVRADGSSADASLHSFAVDAARRSRFSASADAAKSQPGWILYRFIAQ